MLNRAVASGSITATKVDIRRATAVRVTALVDSVNAAANALDLLGITVRIDALTRLERSEDEILLFTNEATERLAVVYKRKDGSYGLLKPSGR